MTTKVLSGTYPAGYAASTTIQGVKVTATGVVGGPGLSATGSLSLTNLGSVAGVDLEAGSVVNTGGIQSGADGGIGVILRSSGAVSNNGGEIRGGDGAAGGSSYKYKVYGGSNFYGYTTATPGKAGGVGVDLTGGGRLVNGGAIDGGGGGQGGNGFVPNARYRNDGAAPGGNGGAGVVLDASGSVLNTGTIRGGAGGAGGQEAGGPSASFGGTGDGVVLSAGGEVINGDRTHTGALISGDFGVDATGSAAATVINFGTIQGGSGAAVDFGSSADRLIAMPGADFIGPMIGGGGTLELDGGTGSVSGIGGGGVLSGADQGSFSDFATYEFDAGGHWTAASVNLAGGDLARSAGALTIDGDVTLAAGSELDESRAGVVRVGAGNTVTNAGLIEAGGTGKIVIQDGVDNTGKLIAKGGDLTIGGSVTGDGSASIFDGVLRIDGAFSENVAFTTSDPSGTLALKHATAYDGKVTGFSTNGKTALDLVDIGFTSASEASFSGNSTGGVLTVSDGTNTAKIKLVGDFVSDTFTAASDGQGGVVVTASDPGASAATARLVQAIASFGAEPPSYLQAPIEPDRATLSIATPSS